MKKGQTIRGGTRTSQDQQRCNTTTFSELYVSIQPVANHDRAFRVEIMPAIEQITKPKGKKMKQ
jgi:hypothetical protein